MAIKLPTDAANDPGMNDPGDKQQGRPQGRPAHHSRTSADSRADESKPGKGINQAGFVRDSDRDTDPGKD